MCTIVVRQKIRQNHDQIKPLFLGQIILLWVKSWSNRSEFLKSLPIYYVNGKEYKWEIQAIHRIPIVAKQDFPKGNKSMFNLLRW